MRSCDMRRVLLVSDGLSPTRDGCVLGRFRSECGFIISLRNGRLAKVTTRNRVSVSFQENFWTKNYSYLCIKMKAIDKQFSFI